MKIALINLPLALIAAIVVIMIPAATMTNIRKSSHLLASLARVLRLKVAYRSRRSLELARLTDNVCENGHQKIKITDNHHHKMDFEY